MGWKRVVPSAMISTADSCFYDLEEIEEADLFANGGLKGKDQVDDGIDWDSFKPMDDFGDLDADVPKDEPRKKVKLQQKQTKADIELLSTSGWDEYNLAPVLRQTLVNMNYLKPTAIQAATLLYSVTRHRDIIGAAETGSGKTLAFGLPILNCIATEEYKYSINLYSNDGITALILVPTRELAIQVTDHLKKAGQDITKKIICVMGGMSVQKQTRLTQKVPDILVATPGRLWALIEEDEELARNLLKIRFLVLDEADRMLEAGHFKHLDDIFDKISPQKHNEDEIKAIKRQTFVFSATMVQDDGIKQQRKKPTKKKEKDDKGIVFANLLDKIEFRDSDPMYINLSRKEITAQGVLESKIDCLKTEKDVMLYYVLCRYQGKTIVFVNSIDAIRRLVPILSHLSPNVFGLHAEMQQKQRLKNLDRFKEAKDAVLIASDVASRGLDIPSVDHVIHYQLPRAADIYVHRAGRTARGAGREGVSVMLCAPEEISLYKKICYSLKKEDGVGDFPVDYAVLKMLKERITLARLLDQLEHKNKKKKNDLDWFKKAAEEADIAVSEDSDPEETNQNDAHHRKEVSKLKDKLALLMQKQLIPKGVSVNYLTSNSNKRFVQVAMKAKGSLLPTVEDSKAVDDFRPFKK